MKRIVHIKLRTVLGILCLVICILPTTQNMGKATAAEGDSLSLPHTSDWTSLPLAEVALVNTYLPHIREASRAYYDAREEELPVISRYYVTLEAMTANSQAENPTVMLTFSLMPYTGAHDTVGVDEVTFEASHTGEITLLEYKRIRDIVTEPADSDPVQTPRRKLRGDLLYSCLFV